MEASKIPNWFWAILAIIAVGTIASVIYCNKTSALYDKGTKADLSTMSDQSTTNTNTTSTKSTPQASATETQVSGAQSIFEQLSMM